MCQELLALQLDADVLFLDDNSPDGTGAVLDELAAQHPRVSVIHRSGKLGIGTAHQAGIARAYELGYDRLITMDCDFTHSPSDLPRLLEFSHSHPVVVGSRYLQQNSLPGWNLLRRTLTMTGHFLTGTLLKMPQDATGALRVYDLRKIPHGLFKMVNAGGYAFFFESLFLLAQNRFEIKEVPIVLPARTYGHSKMSYWEAFRSLRQLFSLYLVKVSNPRRFQYFPDIVQPDPTLLDPQGWDAYWKSKQQASTFLYELIATVYRELILKRLLNRAIRREFATGSRLLHAGCGSGQVDARFLDDYALHALDISLPALHLYQRNNPAAKNIRHGDIFHLPYPDSYFDGVYNLGVMEHFTHEQIVQILREFTRVLKPGGRIVMFWPHRYASSVMVLGAAHHLLNDLLQRSVVLHPPEISLLQGRARAQQQMSDAGLSLERFEMTPLDGYIQAVVVAAPICH